MEEDRAQWRYESGVKMVERRRSITPETGSLGANGLIHLDLSGLYSILHTLVNPITETFGWSRDGAVVRELASHHCVSGSIPGLGVICGLSLLLLREVFLRVYWFSSLLRNHHF